MNSRFSGSSGFGSWFGKVPSGSKKQRTASSGSRSSIGGSITPAIPLAASITTRSGRIASTSTNESTRSTKPGRRRPASPRLCARPAEPRPRRAPGRGCRAAPSRRRPAARPRRTIFIPVYSLGLCEAVTQIPPSSPSSVDGEVDHLRPDHPDVDDVGAGVRGPLDHRLRHCRRGDPHVAPDGDPLRLELLDVGAADRIGAVLVELRPVDPADVVGLEDLRDRARRRCYGRRAEPASGSCLVLRSAFVRAAAAVEAALVTLVGEVHVRVVVHAGRVEPEQAARDERLRRVVVVADRRRRDRSLTAPSETWMPFVRDPAVGPCRSLSCW